MIVIGIIVKTISKTVCSNKKQNKVRCFKMIHNLRDIANQAKHKLYENIFLIIIIY